MIEWILLIDETIIEEYKIVLKCIPNTQLNTLNKKHFRVHKNIPNTLIGKTVPKWYFGTIKNTSKCDLIYT